MTQPYTIEASNPQRALDAQRADERSIGALVTDLWEKTETLVRQEMRLGIAEAEEKVDHLKHDLDDRVRTLKLEVAAKAIGGAVAAGGALSFVAALVLVLTYVMPAWLAAAITGCVLCAVGFALLNRDVKLPAAPPARELVPQRTVESIETDIKAIEEASRGTTK
jgi:Putative Actinobacterial Holin-X, holin superfamily III